MKISISKSLTSNKGVGPLVDLNFLQSTYKVGAVRASAFNTASIPALTVTRASVGYAETAAGVLVPFASGEARITDKGLLVEEQRTNFVKASGDLTNATYWTQTNVGLAATADPLGGSAASTITAAAGSTAHYVETVGGQAATETAGQVYSHSTFVKPGTAPYAVLGQKGDSPWIWATLKWSDLTLSVQGCAAVLDPQIYTGGYRKVTFTYTRTTTGLNNHVVGPGPSTAASVGNTNYTFNAAGTESVGAFGLQGELGGFASSYIPTTTAAATRAADQITVSSVAVPLTNFTLYAEVALDSLAGGGYQGVAALDDGTSANQVYIFKTAGSNRARGGVDIASATVFDTASLSSTLPVLAAGVSKLAFIRAGGIVRVEANGILYPDTTQAALPALSHLNVGRFNGNNFPTNGCVRRITLMDRAVGGLTA